MMSAIIIIWTVMAVHRNWYLDENGEIRMNMWKMTEVFQSEITIWFRYRSFCQRTSGFFLSWTQKESWQLPVITEFWDTVQIAYKTVRKIQDDQKKFWKNIRILTMNRKKKQPKKWQMP